MPSLVPALTDVRGPGSGRQQPLKLRVLVTANRADVEVQPEQARRGRGMGLEHDRRLQAAETGTDRSDLDAVGVPGELGVTEDLAPECRQPRRIAAVEDEFAYPARHFVSLGGSRCSLQADDLIGGPDTEVFEKVRLPPRPGHELIQSGGFEPLVRFATCLLHYLLSSCSLRS